MKLSYIFSGMLVAGTAAFIAQRVMEDTLGNTYKEAEEASKSDSLVRSVVGKSMICIVGSAIGVKGLSWAVKKVRGI